MEIKLFLLCKCTIIILKIIILTYLIQRKLSYSLCIGDKVNINIQYYIIFILKFLYRIFSLNLAQKTAN